MYSISISIYLSIYLSIYKLSLKSGSSRRVTPTTILCVLSAIKSTYNNTIKVHFTILEKYYQGIRQVREDDIVDLHKDSIYTHTILSKKFF